MYGGGGRNVLPLFLALRSNRCEVYVIKLVTMYFLTGKCEDFSGNP